MSKQFYTLAGEILADAANDPTLPKVSGAGIASTTFDTSDGSPATAQGRLADILGRLRAAGASWWDIFAKIKEVVDLIFSQETWDEIIQKILELFGLRKTG